MQGAIRNMQPPARGRQRMIVAVDGDGEIAAVAWMEQVDGPLDVFVKAIAIGVRYRGQGGELARELAQRVVDRAISDAIDEEEYGELSITGNVHRSNQPSAALCR